MSVFELAGLLLTATAVLGYVNHRFIGLSDTVGITFVGLLATLILTIVARFVPGATPWAASFADRLDLPQIVFHGLLGILLLAACTSTSAISPGSGCRSSCSRRSA